LRWYAINNTCVCGLCPHNCDLTGGKTGFCGARAGSGDGVKCLSYGRVTSAALDPIEKKPLSRFQHGSNIFSIGSFGCNLACPFCQNYTIATARDVDGSQISVPTEPRELRLHTYGFSPDEIANQAEELTADGNIGVAFTYNEPLVGFEFVRDTAEKVKARGLLNVVVSNGYINAPYLKELLPLIDAMNIDLKAYNEDFYRNIGGDLETVKTSIKLAAGQCHVEIASLIIDGENDDDAEFDAMCGFLADVDPEIVLHIDRFFPQYKYSNRQKTSLDTLQRLKGIADGHLKYVELGNV
jgi:pyruvate formate lyase activating enzyme